MSSKVENDSKLWNGYQWDGVIDESIFEQYRKEQEIASKEFEDNFNKKEKIHIQRGDTFRHEYGGEKCVVVKSQKRNI